MSFSQYSPSDSQTLRKAAFLSASCRGFYILIKSILLANKNRLRRSYPVLLTSILFHSTIKTMENTGQGTVIGPKIRLVVTKGDDEGTVFETSSFPIIIGRDAQADFRIKKDSNVSRIHAEVTLKSRRLWIGDLGSTNGCIVNNIRATKKTEVPDGSTIILGQTHIKVIVLGSRYLKSTHDSNDSTFIYNSKQSEAMLVLDQCNSSEIIDVYGDELGLKLTEALNKLVLPMFKKHKSQFVKGTGDGFLATFKHPGVACLAAEEIIGRIGKWNKKSGQATEIHVRIGLHYGQSIIEPNGDRHGQAVNITFRIEGLKYKDIKKSRSSVKPKEFPNEDRIFASAEFFEMLDPKKKASTKSLGFFKLKGIKGYFEIHNILQ
jgi:class 3 adenylate cyclase